MKKTRNNIVVYEDDWRNSQTYQIRKSEVLSFIKKEQSTNIGAISRKFKDFTGDLADILSDLQVEKQIQVKEGPPSKIVFIGNIKRQDKEFPKSNQNNLIGTKVNLKPIKKRIPPHYLPYGRNDRTY